MKKPQNKDLHEKLQKEAELRIQQANMIREIRDLTRKHYKARKHIK